MGRRREGGIGFLDLARGPVAAKVARAIVPDLRRRIHRAARLHDRRQYLVFDLDQFRRIARLIQRLGDHEGDAVARIAHLVRGQQGPLPHVTAGAVAIPHRRNAGQGAEALGLDIRAGQHQQDPGRRLGRFGIDGFDAGMGMGRAQDMALGLEGQIDVVQIATIAGQQASILRAPNGFSRAKLAHRDHAFFSRHGKPVEQAAADETLFPMLDSPAMPLQGNRGETVAVRGYPAPPV